MPDFVGTLKPPRLATAPSSPSSGQSYFDTVLNATRYWNGTAWVTTDLRYNGDWAAGSYTDGDIVVYNSTSYLCVRPTSSAPAGWTPVYSAASYGASPPASPVDGQMWVFPADATNGVNWMFRYNAGSASAYKWEFIGGAPIYAAVTADESLGASTGSWVNVTTIGPDVSAARPGDYRADVRARCNCANAGLVHLGVANASVSSTAVGTWASASLAAGAYADLAAQTSITGVSGGQTLRATYFSNIAAATYGLRSLTVTPVRVS